MTRAFTVTCYDAAGVPIPIPPALTPVWEFDQLRSARINGGSDPREVELLSGEAWRRGGRKIQKQSLASADRVARHLKRAQPPVILPEGTRTVGVSARLPDGSYFARYALLPLLWERRCLFVPEGAGKTLWGDFTDYEEQRFAADVTPDPFRPNGHLIRFLEEIPPGDNDPRTEDFYRALIRAHFPTGSVHAIGRGKEFVKVVRLEKREERTQPVSAARRKSAKGRRR